MLHSVESRLLQHSLCSLLQSLKFIHTDFIDHLINYLSSAAKCSFRAPIDAEPNLSILIVTHPNLIVVVIGFHGFIFASVALV